MGQNQERLATMADSLKSLQTAGPCMDGCGSLAKAGSSYLPGHDAKLDSMLQRYADGEITELPALVVENLAAHVGKTMPAPRFRMVELKVTLKVRIAADTASPLAEAKTIVHKRLNVRAVQVDAIDAVRASKKSSK